MKNFRFALLLLIAVMWTTIFPNAQELTASTAVTVASTFDYDTAESLQRYSEISALPLRDRPNFFRSYSAWEQSNLSRIHLALVLVKRPELNHRQVQIVLEAIALKSSEFFAATQGTPADKAKANEALQALTRRAHGILPHNEAAEIFANVGGDRDEDEILKKYNDISALPIPKRKTFFRNGSSKDKSDLWRTHLALFFVKRPEMNTWQKETILTAMALATPGWFEVGSRDPAWKTKVGDVLRSLEDRILVAFSLDEGAKIFATLGDSTDIANRAPVNTRPVLLTSINYTPTIKSTPYKQWTTTGFAEQDIELEKSACQCSTQSDWCPLYSRCTGTESCSATQSGCGTLWSYPCNGASCQ